MKKAKKWYEFQNQDQDVLNLLSGMSYAFNRLKPFFNEVAYESIVGDFILLKNKIVTGNRHSRYEDISCLSPIVYNKKTKN